MESKKQRNRPWCFLCKPYVQLADRAEFTRHTIEKHQTRLFGGGGG